MQEPSSHFEAHVKTPQKGIILQTTVGVTIRGILGFWTIAHVSNSSSLLSPALISSRLPYCGYDSVLLSRTRCRLCKLSDIQGMGIVITILFIANVKFIHGEGVFKPVSMVDLLFLSWCQKPFQNHL